MLTLLLIGVVGMALSVGASMFNPQQAHALSAKNKAAHKAYSKVLWKTCIANDAEIEYYCTDIDGDKVDEMVMWGGYEAAGTQLYTYKSDKARKLVTVSHGGYYKYYKKSKTLYASFGHMGVERDVYYKWNDKKIKTVLAMRVTDSNTIPTTGKSKVTYQVKGKSVSAAKYKAYVKKLTKGSKVNLANKKMKSYKPVTSEAKAKQFMRAWLKAHKNINPPVDRIDYDQYNAQWGYRLHGVWSYPSHDATAFWCYVSKTGRVRDYTGVGTQGLSQQNADQQALQAASL